MNWGERVDTGEMIPLEPRAELGPGASRYVITGSHAGHYVVTPVSVTAPVEAYADHRLECPDHANGHP